MAIIVRGSSPSSLLSEIKLQIDRKHIDTWKFDKDGDFTHSPYQWSGKAWLRPAIMGDVLKFGILYPKDATKDKTIYAVFHGRFIEMLLAHFDAKFVSAEATANLVSPDVF